MLCFKRHDDISTCLELISCGNDMASVGMVYVTDTAKSAFACIDVQT